MNPREMATVTLTPATWDDLAAGLRTAHVNRTAVAGVDLSRLNRIRRYAPEDLTVTVEAGMTLGQLQAELGRHGQWLPLDPPGAERLTLARIIDENLSGPRRYGYGTIREHLIGLRVALADGRIIRSGGEVVKNVAGYDLMKLFVGARGSLGVVLEAAFKLMPRPAREAVVARSCATWEDAGGTIERVLESPLTPVAFDLHNLGLAVGQQAILVLMLAGSPEEVAWQLGEARAIGISDASSLEHANAFVASPTHPIQTGSVLPSRLIETLRELNPRPFVARAGNGVIYHQGSAPPDRPASAPSPVLVQRIKATYDPNGILPAPPLE